MKKYIIWIILGLIVLWGVMSYNSLASRQVAVNQQWGQVEVVYQRRMDLIPNLVEVVKGYARFEKSTLTEITQMRSQVGQAHDTYKNPNATVDEKVGAVNQMESALSRLLVVVERYPDLKAGEQYMALQVELSGTENRVATERRKYNEAVGSFNNAVVRFPSNLMARIFGYSEKKYFEAKAGAENAPKVEGF
jgi:LemA protein